MVSVTSAAFGIAGGYFPGVPCFLLGHSFHFKPHHHQRRTYNLETTYYNPHYHLPFPYSCIQHHGLQACCTALTHPLSLLYSHRRSLFNKSFLKRLHSLAIKYPSFYRFTVRLSQYRVASGADMGTENPRASSMLPPY